MGRAKEKRGKRRRKEVKGLEGGERKGEGWKNGREKKEEREGERGRERWYPTFWYKVTPMSASDIHTRRIGLATQSISTFHDEHEH